MNASYYLTILILLPLLGGLVVAALGPLRAELVRRFGLGFSLASLALVVFLWFNFDPAEEFCFPEKYQWIPALGVSYSLGVDGLGMLMVLLTSLLVPFSLLVSWRINSQVHVFFALVLFLQSGLYGVFTALNFFHWFIFWELVLIPAFFLIKLWGGTRRTPAALQFFVFTMVGSVAMLLAFQAIFLAAGTFDFDKLAKLGQNGTLHATLGSLAKNLGWHGFFASKMPMLVCLGILLGLAVKVPLMPLHSWLPLAYSEAPTGVSMLLTGVLSKMGVYGFLRILLPIFPQEMRALLVPLLLLTVVTIVVSAWAAMAQTDLKRMIAYSSINHLGYCLLGIFAAAQSTRIGEPWLTEKAAALNGVILQMFNHGLSASALFCFIGWIEQRSGGLRGLHDFGGLRQAVPVFTGLMGIALFSSLGLPGLNGFIGEFLIFKGAFSLAGWAAALSVLGLLLTAIFLLNILQQVFSGPLPVKWQGFGDLTFSERLIVAPVIALMFIIGIYPQFLIGVINPTVVRLITLMGN